MKYQVWWMDGNDRFCTHQIEARNIDEVIDFLDLEKRGFEEDSGDEDNLFFSRYHENEDYPDDEGWLESYQIVRVKDFGIGYHPEPIYLTKRGRKNVSK